MKEEQEHQDRLESERLLRRLTRLRDGIEILSIHGK